MITFRLATPDDLPTLLLWDEQPHVIVSDPDEEWNWFEELQKTHAWRKQYIAELDGRPIGIIQVINPAQEETHYWGEIAEGYRALDIWIGLEQDLGKGYGTIMMREIICRCFDEQDVHTILIDPLTSNTRAIAFYTRMGFLPVEERRLGDSDCLVMELRRENWSG